eukprot:5632963-Prymnesium_polylepis.1
MESTHVCAPLDEYLRWKAAEPVPCCLPMLYAISSSFSLSGVRVAAVLISSVSSMHSCVCWGVAVPLSTCSFSPLRLAFFTCELGVALSILAPDFFDGGFED